MAVDTLDYLVDQRDEWQARAQMAYHRGRNELFIAAINVYYVFSNTVRDFVCTVFAHESFDTQETLEIHNVEDEIVWYTAE